MAGTGEEIDRLGKGLRAKKSGVHLYWIMHPVGCKDRLVLDYDSVLE